MGKAHNNKDKKTILEGAVNDERLFTTKFIDSVWHNHNPSTTSIDILEESKSQINEYKNLTKNSKIHQKPSFPSSSYKPKLADLNLE